MVVASTPVPTSKLQCASERRSTRVGAISVAGVAAASGGSMRRFFRRAASVPRALPDDNGRRSRRVHSRATPPAMRRRSLVALLAIALAHCGPSLALTDAARDTSDAATADDTTVYDAFHDGFAPLDSVSFIEAGSTDVLGTVHGACSTLMNPAPPIVPTTSTAPMPAPTGGTIGDGWYFLTASTRYVPADAGPDGDDAGDASLEAAVASRSVALLIVGARVMYEIARTGRDADSTVTYTFSLSGSRIVLTGVCPTTAASPIDGYDATATTLALHDSMAHQIDTYARQ
jgi:hypothetical protein